MDIDISSLAEGKKKEEEKPDIDGKYIREFPEENRASAEEEPEEEKPEEEEEYRPKGLALTSFEYNVTNEEENMAFTIFQRKYVYKHNFLITGLFGLVGIMFLIACVRDPSAYLNWILCFICFFMIFMTWFNTFRVKKYLISALKPLEEDIYKFSLYDECFKIETVFTEEEMAAEDFVPVKPRIVKFEDISLNIIETSELFVIILRKETIYVLSKRIISEDDQKLLRDKFSELLREDYEIRT
ncbi:MAG: hypothetical protein IJ806_02640 [Ruminococcus sp.]|nr:hypothetical protein [Ruminococcus sp.]